MKVPGIGRKGAQRIVLELKDRLGAPSGAGAAPPAPVAAGAGLARPGAATRWWGWAGPPSEADDAVDAVAADADRRPAGGAPTDVAGAAARRAAHAEPRAPADAPGR